MELYLKPREACNNLNRRIPLIGYNFGPEGLDSNNNRSMQTIVLWDFAAIDQLSANVARERCAVVGAKD